MCGSASERMFGERRSWLAGSCHSRDPGPTPAHQRSPWTQHRLPQHNLRRGQTNLTLSVNPETSVLLSLRALPRRRAQECHDTINHPMPSLMLCLLCSKGLGSDSMPAQASIPSTPHGRKLRMKNLYSIVSQRQLPQGFPEAHRGCRLQTMPPPQ